MVFEQIKWGEEVLSVDVRRQMTSTSNNKRMREFTDDNSRVTAPKCDLSRNEKDSISGINVHEERGYLPRKTKKQE